MVKLGVENIDNYLHLFTNKRVGLITNPTGVDKQLLSTIDILNQKTNLVALFSPEHGVRGDLQAGVRLDDYVDPKTGIKVYSLYGQNKKPNKEMMDQIDVLVFDIQDVGARFYTFVYTMAYAMMACQEHGKKMVVLDRPNPVNGVAVEGNILNILCRSFVGYYPLPQRYGLTIGELAMMFNQEFEIHCDLTVVKMDGYDRNLDMVELSLPWVLPSPNIPTVETTYHYLGTCVFEGTTLSEGRGTTKPFQIIGSPYLDVEYVLQEIRKHQLEGVLFREIYFTPTFSKHQGELCRGIELIMTDKHKYQPVKTAYILLDIIRNHHDEFDFIPPWSKNGKPFIDYISGDEYIRNNTLTLEEQLQKINSDTEIFKNTKGGIIYMTNYNVDNLTLEEKLGQLLVFGFDALDINDHALNLIKTYKAGNIILFARNVKTPEQVFELNQNLQKLALKEIGIPLLITIDQEGGMVTRIKNGGTFFPGAMTLGASNTVKNSYLSGKYMGKELISLGINMNLAPVLDINNNPYNPVIGVRSYSDQKEKVSDYGYAFIKGMQEHVTATAKHFPGHGDTKVDSHLALPAIHKTYEEIVDLELVPFKHAIDRGLQAIMSSHINFPAITEDGLPTTLSKNCLTGLLREKLQFEGLIITDCMQMKAIQKDYGTPNGVVMAINAGANLVCVSHSEELQTASLDALKEAVQNEVIPLDVIHDRVEKILEYKRKYIKPNLNLSYQDVKHIVENKSTKEFALDVVRNGVTLIKGVSPINLKNTLLLASEPLSTTIADEDDGSYSIIQSVKKDIPQLDTMKVSVKLDDEEINRILQKTVQYEQVIFCSYNANIYQNQIKLIDQLEEQGKLFVIMMRNPYDSVFAKTISNLLAMYEYTPNSVKVLVEFLKGELIPKGVLPVTL